MPIKYQPGYTPPEVNLEDQGSIDFPGRITRVGDSDYLKTRKLGNMVLEILSTDHAFELERVRPLGSGSEYAEILVRPFGSITTLDYIKKHRKENTTHTIALSGLKFIGNLIKTRSPLISGLDMIQLNVFSWDLLNPELQDALENLNIPITGG